MQGLKAMGILAVILAVAPFVWLGVGKVDTLHSAAGPACIIDGDETRRVTQVTGRGTPYYVIEGGTSTCALSGAHFASATDQAAWQVDGETYNQVVTYVANSPWPAPAWDWPITMTWDDGLETLEDEGWQGQLYGTYLSLLTVVILLAFLGLAFFVLTEPEEEET